MRVSIIAAVAENGVIGRGGQLPWHLPDDLKRFKALMMGHAVVMGRKTWESIGRPLPGRRMIVVTRQHDYRPESVEVAGSLQDALAIARAASEDECFIIGGAEIYREALPYVDRVYLTLVRADIDGDTYFPWAFDSGNSLDKFFMDWVMLESREHDASVGNEYPFSFLTLQRCEPKRST